MTRTNQDSKVNPDSSNNEETLDVIDSNGSPLVITVPEVVNSVGIGECTTGPILLLRNKNIVLKSCDSWKNHEGIENEVEVFKKSSQYNLNCVPKYYGYYDFCGQVFLALEYIKGKNFEWDQDQELR